MLELRPICENCSKKLPPNSTEAMICTYECTFCAECVTNILHNVCPNCGGGFEKRPIRKQANLVKDPPTLKEIYKPVNLNSIENLLNQFQSIPPELR